MRLHSFWRIEQLLITDLLQFSRIFVLSFPERTDKRDGIVMGASLSGFNFDWIEGVKGSEISEKAVPKVRQCVPSSDRR